MTVSPWQTSWSRNHNSPSGCIFKVWKGVNQVILLLTLEYEDTNLGWRIFDKQIFVQSRICRSSRTVITQMATGSVSKLHTVSQSLNTSNNRWFLKVLSAADERNNLKRNRVKAALSQLNKFSELCMVWSSDTAFKNRDKLSLCYSSILIFRTIL